MADTTDKHEDSFVEYAKLLGGLGVLTDKLSPEERREFDRIMAEARANEEDEPPEAA